MRPARRRQLVDEFRATWKVSIRRACAGLRTERSSYHYKGQRPSQAALAKRIKEICEVSLWRAIGSSDNGERSATATGGFICFSDRKAGR